MPPPVWLPDTAAVAALIPTRTLQSDGSYGADFTPATRPTAVQVAALVSLIATEVAGEVGVVPAAQDDQAAYVVALGAAALVEVSYFPEQVRSAQSAYPDLDARYTEALDRLTYSVAEGGEGESLTAQWSFPSPSLLFNPPVAPGVDPNAGPRTTFFDTW